MRGISLALILMVVGGCKMTEGSVPALLERTDEAAISALQTSLANALGQASVQLGPEDLTTSSVISVLPRQPSALEGRSVSMPIQFDLVLEGGSCLLVHRETGEVHALQGIGCRPA